MVTVTRSVKVRWPGKLTCGCYVVSGWKYLVPGRGWCCRECSGLARLMTEPPRPSERGTDSTDREERP